MHRSLAAVAVVAVFSAAAAAAAPDRWAAEWSSTDFSRHSVDLSEIRSGGPPKDGIPSIDE
ncbi:MAG: DUF3179 domain-containing (seleno)protein, partial [Acetobacterales bacterium]